MLWAFLLWVGLSLAAFSSDEMLKKEAQSSDSIITVVSDSFDQMFNGPKDYFLVTFFTASDPAIGCKSCVGFDPIYESVANSVLSSRSKNINVFFTKVDFSENKQNFAKLNMSTVPHVWVYPPQSEETGFVNVTSPHYVYMLPDMIVAMKDISAGETHFAKFLSEILMVNILVQKGFDYTEFFQYFLITFSFIFLVRKRGGKMVEKIKKSFVWKIVCIMFILVSVTGYSFSMQRQVPFLAKNDQGNIMYLAGSLHFQFGSEILISSLLYMLLGLSVLSLCDFIPKLESSLLQSMATIIAAAALFVVWNVLSTAFLVKNPDYPFVVWKLKLF